MTHTVLSNSFELIRIALFMAVLFVGIPMFIRKPEKGRMLENIVNGFCVSIFSGIIITYSLVITRLFDALLFLILFFPITTLIYFWVEEINFREMNIKDKIKNFVLKLFSKIEKREFSEINVQKLTVSSPMPAAAGKFFTKLSKIIFLIIAISVFFYIFLLRLMETLPHKLLYYSDSYGHLMITKLFLMGKSMYEKFYPLGYHSIISDIKMVSFSDLADIVRFLGPIQSVLVVFSVFYFVFMITKNKPIALFAAAILGLDSLDIWPLVFYRQLVALPQEFATIFFLPTLYFCLEYIKTRENKYLKYFFIALCNIFLIHEYVGILVFWTVLGAAVTGLIFRLWTKTTFKKFTLAGIISCVIGAVPFILWFLVGMIFALPNRQGEIIPDGGFIYRYVNFRVRWEDLVSFLYDAINPIKDISKWHNQLSANIIIYLLIGSLIYLFLRCAFRIKFFERHYYLFALAITQIFFVCFYYGFYYNLISIMYFERIGLVLSICGAAIAGLLFNEIYCFLKNMKKKRTQKYLIFYPGLAILNLSIYAFITAMVVWLPYEKTDTIIYQYEGALKAYYHIKEENEFLNWTIVSPVEELSEVYGYGYHYELWNFLDDFNLSYAKDKNFDFGKKIPTEHIFIFEEKDPLLVWFTMPSTVYKISETERYYRLYQGRCKLEKQLVTWMNEYRKSHEGLSNQAEVFYEDEKIVVYHIQHNISKK